MSTGLSLGKSLLKLIFLFICVSFISFALTYFADGDPAQIILVSSGANPTQELIELTRVKYGLDQPFLVQYGRWLVNVLHGDFGMSYVSQKSVLTLLVPKIQATLLLACSTLFLSLIIAIPLSIISAYKENTIIDNIIKILNFLWISLPGFVAALLILYIFGVKFKLFPIVSSYVSWQTIILPTITLSLAISAKYIRQLRNLISSQLTKEYIIGARLRGLPEWMVFLKHLVPNISIPFLTIIGMSFGSLVGGVAVIEIIFSWPGIGKYAVEAINYRDYPVIQAYVLWMSVIYMSVNYFIDRISYVIDKRIGG